MLKRTWLLNSHAKREEKKTGGGGEDQKNKKGFVLFL